MRGDVCVDTLGTMPEARKNLDLAFETARILRADIHEQLVEIDAYWPRHWWQALARRAARRRFDRLAVQFEIVSDQIARIMRMIEDVESFQQA